MKRPPKLTVIQGGGGTPPEPDWALWFDDVLDRALAHETWTSVIAEMRAAETLTMANGFAIERLCQFRIHWERSSRHVAEHGAVLKRAKAKVGAWNPNWSVMRQSDEAIRLIEAELCISPVRRSKAGKARKPRPRKPSAADEFLG